MLSGYSRSPRGPDLLGRVQVCEVQEVDDEHNTKGTHGRHGVHRRPPTATVSSRRTRPQRAPEIRRTGAANRRAADGLMHNIWPSMPNQAKLIVTRSQHAATLHEAISMGPSDGQRNPA